MTEDTAKNEVIVQEISRFIDERNGIDTIALDIRGQNSFTDYFIITTTTSWAHMKGLFRELKGFLREQGTESRNRHKIEREETWVLIDCGNIIVHLMNREMRKFYELEKLWFSGTVVYQSSKSSKSSPSS